MEKINFNPSAIPDQSDFRARLEMHRSTLSNSEAQVAEFFLENKERCLDLTIYQIAKEINTSVATITRFCQSLGYEGLADLKFNLKQKPINLINADTGICHGDDIPTIRQKTGHFLNANLEHCLTALDDKALEQAVRLLSGARQLLVTGIGTAACIAQTAASMFLTAGIPAYFASDPQIQLRMAAVQSPGTVLVAINYDGTAKPVGDMLLVARQMGIHSILITSVHNTLLEKYADTTLYTPMRTPGDVMSITATTMCQLAVVELLLIAVSTQRFDSLGEMRQLQLHISDLNRYDSHQTELHIAKVRQIKAKDGT